MEKHPHSPTVESVSAPLIFSDTLSPLRTTTSRRSDKPAALRQPWRHSVSTRHGPLPTSRTVREFRPGRQRRRLFAQGFTQFLITVAFCGLLAACLAVFGRLSWMSVQQVKAFNALIVLLSLFLGNNLTSSFKEMALILRWKILAANYRSLDEFDLIMHCESLRKVLKLCWIAREPGRAFWLNKTQILCLMWVGVNIMLQILVALLGLTYNLNTSTVPARKLGQISVANFSIIDDPWTTSDPGFDSQLGSSNIYGSQAQYYAYKLHKDGRSGDAATWGRPSSPTLYYNENYTTFSYIFEDSNPTNPDLTLLTYRNISSTTTCEQLEIVSGGNGTSSIITFIDENRQQRTIDVARVGPGAMTYIGVLNSTCGPRCTNIMALQSANGDTIPTPSFFTCQNAITPISGIERYLMGNATEDVFQIPEAQTRMLAGAIGWTGFNFTSGDTYQYARYPTLSWWSPNFQANATRIAMNIMEYSVGAIASFDYNGPRSNVTGYFPIPAQEVDIQWKWSATILAVTPLVHLIALVGVIAWGNTAIIRDASCLSTAKLLRPIVEKLGESGCLLSGQEIAEELASVRVKYGWREPSDALVFSNEINQHFVRHVDILEEHEGFGGQGTMPPGRYDGLGLAMDAKDEHTQDDSERTDLLRRRRTRRSMSM